MGERARAAGHGPSSVTAVRRLTGPGFNSATDTDVPHDVCWCRDSHAISGSACRRRGRGRWPPTSRQSALSWAITRWPTAMSSQVAGKPGAACAAPDWSPLG